MSRKIIIDTLKSPELQVLGLTTVFGNVRTQTCTTNALRLLEIAGRSDLPVSEGAPCRVVPPPVPPPPQKQNLSLPWFNRHDQCPELSSNSVGQT
jgi:inosine-uridine nucleoside N-ribohydrolase